MENVSRRLILEPINENTTFINSLLLSFSSLIAFRQQNTARDTPRPLKSFQYTCAISSKLIWAQQNNRILGLKTSRQICLSF